MASNFALWDTIEEKVISYPRGDDEPVVSLDPRYQVLRIVKEDKPEVPDGWSIRQTRAVDLDAMEWRWGWELIEPLPVPPVPDWRTFKRTLLGHPAINALLGGSMTAAPAAAISLPATLLAAAGGGDSDDFRAAWLSLRRLDLVSTELLQEVRGLAINCHLPESFVAALGGSVQPDAQELGQEWVDADGYLWRVVQARDVDGQFLPDDPTTPERESLIWEKTEA
jgi:hypothetical protein